MGAFSKKYKTVDEVEEGAVVAVPDDPSNEARALRVLAAAGLIEVNDGELITTADITSNPKNLEFKEFVEKDDFLSFDGKENSTVVLEEGDFLICYPEDIHMTCLKADNEPSDVKKAIYQVIL